jgi:hypothetical protein
MEGLWQFAPISSTSWIVNRVRVIESGSNMNAASRVFSVHMPVADLAELCLRWLSPHFELFGAAFG